MLKFQFTSAKILSNLIDVACYKGILKSCQIFLVKVVRKKRIGIILWNHHYSRASKKIIQGIFIIHKCRKNRRLLQEQMLKHQEDERGNETC